MIETSEIAQHGPLELVSKGNHSFANRMYQELAKEPGNVFFSPMSAHTVLSLVAQGAAGVTLEEFNAVLGVDQKTSADGYESVMKTLNNTENVTLNLANKLYVQDGYEIKENFKAVASDKFLSTAESINFAQKQAAANKINRWCLEKTNNKIQNVINPSYLDADTRMVLLNAIYFKGQWLFQFKKANTKKRRFYIKENETISVDMMYLSATFNYCYIQYLDAEILEMKYKNQDISMVIILPQKKDGIAALEQKLAEFDLSTLTEKSHKSKVDVFLPKFKIQTEIFLNDVLKSMGIVTAFTNSADFSQLIDSPGPFVISSAIQKAFIEVNEEGAEAAVVTAIGPITFGSAASPVRKQIFNADHPFVYLLLARVENQINVLFSGRIVYPIT